MAKRSRCGKLRRVCVVVTILALLAAVQLCYNFRAQANLAAVGIAARGAQSFIGSVHEVAQQTTAPAVATAVEVSKPSEIASEGEPTDAPSESQDPPVDGGADDGDQQEADKKGASVGFSATVPESASASSFLKEPPPLQDASPSTRLLAIYRQLCEWGAFSAGKVKKLSADRRDELTRMYAPLVEAQPPAPLLGQRPGGRLTAASADCNLPALRGANVLTGRLRPQGPRMLVDLFTGMGGGAELELLELRLHELDGVADVVVVTESHFGNRCDRKELHFERQKARFEQFLPRILHVVTDRCPEYMKKAQNCHKKKPSQRPHSIYFQEETQRACATKRLREERPDLPDDALVVVTDLDEIPDGRTLHALKHCELREGLRLPIKLQLQVMPFNLRNRCPESRSKYIKGNIALWEEVKLAKRDLLWPKSHTDTLPNAGVHLSAYGSRAQLDYRFIHHGESGMILQTIGLGGQKMKLCKITTVKELDALQQQLNDSPLSVIRSWEKKNDPNKKLKRVTVADLSQCKLPWPLLTSPARYAFLWGDGAWA